MYFFKFKVLRRFVGEYYYNITKNEFKELSEIKNPEHINQVNYFKKFKLLSWNKFL